MPAGATRHVPTSQRRGRRSYNPRSRGLSEHRVFSYEECGIPAHMPGWRHQWEEDCGKKCQRWVGTRDSTGCCEHEGCNIAVFTRTLVSILHSQWRNHHLFRRKNRMVQPDSLNVGNSWKIRANTMSSPPLTAVKSQYTTSFSCCDRGGMFGGYWLVA